jgi:hypothetical protein
MLNARRENAHFSCNQCQFSSIHYTDILKHNEIIHPGSPFMCGIDACPKFYKSKRTLYYHVKAKHKEFYAIHVSGDQGDLGLGFLQPVNEQNVLVNINEGEDGEIDEDGALVIVEPPPRPIIHDYEKYWPYFFSE